MSGIWKVCAALLAAALAACGGGSDGGTTPPPNPPANTSPNASAGAAQNVNTGVLVTLNGSASSDANGDALTYVWSLTSRPVGSTAVLAGASSAAPTFTADAAGTYIASLVVHDGKVDSSASTVTVTASIANAAPVANAGAAQNVITSTLVTLSGNASSDANGDALTYAWTLTSRPAASTAVLTGADSVTPSFTPELAGTYVASLVVNDGHVNSTASTVTVTATVGNAAPVANAGPAQTVFAASAMTPSRVQINGSASSDANGDPLTYAWTLTSRPPGSAAVITNVAGAAAEFWNDGPGVYVATLVVNDGMVSSVPATVTITSIVAVPLTADPGPDQTVAPNTTVTLDGTNSRDPYGAQPSTYQWSMVSQAPGSVVTIQNASSGIASFVPNMVGDFVVELQVTAFVGGGTNFAYARATIRVR